MKLAYTSGYMAKEGLGVALQKVGSECDGNGLLIASDNHVEDASWGE